VGALPGVELPFDDAVFNEFVLRLPEPADGFIEHARERGLLAGLPLDGICGCGRNDLLVAVTEKRGAGDIARYAELLKDYLD